MTRQWMERDTDLLDQLSAVERASVVFAVTNAEAEGFVPARADIARFVKVVRGELTQEEAMQEISAEHAAADARGGTGS